MKKITITVCSFIVMICVGCNDVKKDSIKKEISLQPPMVLIELGEHEGLRDVQKQIKLATDSIISEELDKLCKDKKVGEYPVSGMRPQLVLTLVYIGVFNPSYEPAFISILEIMQNLGRGVGPVSKLQLAKNFDFFGDEQDMIVMKINDEKESLASVRNDIKEALLTLNDYYRKENKNQDLFPAKDIDKLSFVPHVTLNRIPCKRIEEYAQKCGAKEAGLCERIKDRVRKEVLTNVVLKKETQDMAISEFHFWGHKHKSLKTFYLKK